MKVYICGVGLEGFSWHAAMATDKSILWGSEEPLEGVEEPVAPDVLGLEAPEASNSDGTFLGERESGSDSFLISCITPAGD